jgi:hypothetical protein
MNEVKQVDQLIAGKLYELVELADNVFFTYKSSRYRTMTYPPFNKQRTRPCYNFSTSKVENITQTETVRIYAPKTKKK